MTTTTKRRALLVSTDDEPMTDIESELRSGGYDIVRCHPTGAPSFPCAALTDDGCPLAHAPVDVTVDIRQHPWPHPTPREQGVACSVQHGIPVVVVGRPRHPFVPWATIGTESTDRLATRCDQAIRAATAPLQLAAAGAIRSVLQHHGEDEPFVVDVSRLQGRIHIRITARLSNAVAGMAASRAVSSIRALDATSSSVEVEVAEPV